MTPSIRCQGLIIHLGGAFRLGPLDHGWGPGLHRIAGPNGAGKTTLMRCLCGLLRPNQGTVEVMGADPFASRAVRRQVAFLPSHPDLPDELTVCEAVRLMAALRSCPHWDPSPWRQALQLPLHLPLGQASAGQRRKAELLAALAGDPPILLLDEPLANLDSASAALVRSWLQDWRSTRLVLFSAHEEDGAGAQVDSTLLLTCGAEV